MDTLWHVAHAPAPRSPAAPRRATLLAAAALAWIATTAPAPRAAMSARGPAVSASWTGVPLAKVATRLTSLAGRTVVVDRRVDPDTPVTLDLRGVALEEALAAVCRVAGTGCAVLGDTIQLVPEGRQAGVVAADRRRAAALGRLPRARRDLAERRAPLSWPDGATLAALVADTAAGAGVDLDGIDALPHDHLRGAEVAPLPLATRLDLLLVPYGRQVDWARATSDGARVRARVVTAPEDDAPAPSPVMAAADAWEGFAPPRAETAAASTWSLEVAAPLDRLLATIADRMGLDLDLDREGLRQRGIPAAGIVRLSVKDASREELLDEVTSPLGLVWSIEGTTLRVGPSTGP